MIALKLRIRGDSGKRSRSIVSRTSSAKIALSVVGELRFDLNMRRNRSDGDTAPLTLGQALTAQVRLIVWCKACGQRAEPEVAEQVSHYGAGMTVIDWAAPAALFGKRLAFGIGQSVSPQPTRKPAARYPGRVIADRLVLERRIWKSPSRETRRCRNRFDASFAELAPVQTEL